jgi:hypothetical protein
LKPIFDDHRHAVWGPLDLGLEQSEQLGLVGLRIIFDDPNQHRARVVVLEALGFGTLHCMI